MKGSAGAFVATPRQKRCASVTYATPRRASSVTLASIWAGVEPSANPPSMQWTIAVRPSAMAASSAAGSRATVAPSGSALTRSSTSCICSKTDRM